MIYNILIKDIIESAGGDGPSNMSLSIWGKSSLERRKRSGPR
jgi:hypothetical protein